MTGQVVLVHGAWHQASWWDRVVAELGRLNVETPTPRSPGGQDF